MNPLDTALVFSRGIHVVLALLAFGLLAFEPLARREAPALTALIRRSAARAALGAAGAGLLWLGVQAAVFAGAPTLGAALAAVPATLDTRYGHVLLPQLLVLLAVPVLTRRPGSAALAMAALGLGLHALVGHLAVDLTLADSPYVLAQAGHLLAAGAWLGGIVGLLRAVPMLPPVPLGRLSRGFSPIGTLCVAVLALSAGFNGYALIGGLGGLLGTPYGRLALGKTALFILMLLLAAGNRWRITPALMRSAATAPRRLARSLRMELVAGLAVVALAALLASSVPAVHDQPWWPWGHRWSAGMLSDPDLGGDAWRALLLSGAAVVLGLGALLPLRRRGQSAWGARGALLLAAALCLWRGAPDLDLLTVEAYPTSFWASPSGFTAASIARGAALFPRHCASCHGANGTGDGPLADKLPVPPADLTAGHLLDHSDGDVFWWLSHGIPNPDDDGAPGSLVMPGFAATLSEDDRWALIDYIHAHNSGANLRATGNRWTRALSAPELPLECADNPTVGALADVLGNAVLISVAAPGGNESGGQNSRDANSRDANRGPTSDGAARALAMLRAGGLTLVRAVPESGDAAPAPPGICLARANEAVTAYQALTGLSVPLTVLVDDRGALRQAWPGPLPTTVAATQAVLAALRDARQHPFATASSGHHHH